ncbi:MAG TPA: HEAT repeat domain-containing protein, partial [Anseongella sp.]|nr:HEAT repeat domain-containing protein [Anseongella sp.]
HLPDLLTSKDDWFRPVNLKFGPDGCLYIADWYNKIISHNEVPTTHPDRDKSRGRIWRIRHVSQPPRTVPDLYEMAPAGLVSSLESPSLWEKRAAWHQIAERPAAAAPAGPLRRLLADETREESARIHALWSLEATGNYDAGLWKELLQNSPDDLRREAIRSLASFQLGAEELAEALKGLIGDSNPMIRSQVIRTLAEAGKACPQTIALLVQACKPELPGTALGGPYERRFERYLARKALEQYQEALGAYLAGNPEAPAENLIWALQALPREAKGAAFRKVWPRAGLKTLDESTFVAISSMLTDKAVYELVRPLLEDPAHAGKYVGYAIANQASVQSPELARILRAPVNTLLLGNSPEETDLALDAIGRFKIAVPGSSITALFSRKPTEKTIELIIKALEGSPGADPEIFGRLVRDGRLSFSLRAAALHSLARINAGAAGAVLEEWLPALGSVHKRDLAEVLAGSVRGAGLLKDSYDEKLIGAPDIPLSAAERIQQSQPGDSRGTLILAEVKKQQETGQGAGGKLGRYLAIAERKGGDPAKGAVLFQTCQMCHRVGAKGLDLAPALDGSANRDNEALLTAILDPDAAVESGYAVYRVSRKDGSNYQGMLLDKNERGTTLAFMGGSTIFIEAAAIKSQGFLPGRSFMPKGLIEGYSDEQVADLLAYIRTLR